MNIYRILRILRSPVTIILFVTRSIARRIWGSSPLGLISLTLAGLLLLAVFSRSAEVTNYIDSGSCFDLAGRYLKFTGRPYIIDSRLKDYSCNWNFQGNTQIDFETWCRYSGLKCGGNPYFVGFDSTWYNGEYMPVKRAEYLRSVQHKSDSLEAFNASLSASARARADSLANLPPLPKKRVTIQYLELGRSTAERLGFSYSDWIGSAHFFAYDDLFSVSIQALDIGDTSFVFRTYSSVYDSSLSVFWGGHRDRLKSSNVTSNGVISNNYETESFGLTFRIDGLKYYYEHSTDYEHSINGSGLLEFGTNRIFGSYQFDYEQVRAVPVLGSIPVLGFVFRHSSIVSETRYMFISVDVSDVPEGLK